jgi:hypothetical protein
MTCIHNNAPCTICFMDNGTRVNRQLLYPKQVARDVYRSIQYYKNRVYVYFQPNKRKK